jgi:hypothetical protein
MVTRWTINFEDGSPSRSWLAVVAGLLRTHLVEVLDARGRRDSAVDAPIEDPELDAAAYASVPTTDGHIDAAAPVGSTMKCVAPHLRVASSSELSGEVLGYYHDLVALPRRHGEEIW